MELFKTIIEVLGLAGGIISVAGAYFSAKWEARIMERIDGRYMRKPEHEDDQFITRHELRHEMAGIRTILNMIMHITKIGDHGDDQ